MLEQGPVRYGRIWHNLPMRTRVAVSLLLPVPFWGVAVILLHLIGIYQFQLLVLPAAVLEVLVAVWVVEIVLRQARSLKLATDRILEEQPVPELFPHFWELNVLGSNLESLASSLTRAQREVRDSRAEIARLLDESPAACLETGPDGAIKRLNEAASQLLGQTPEEICRLHAWEIFHAADGPASQESVLAKLKGEEAPATFEQEFVSPGGVRGLAQVRESLVRDNAGRVFGIRYALADLTPRLRAAEVLAQCEADTRRKDAELTVALAEAATARDAESRFLSNVSNDLRVPLNGIIGFAELMFDGKIGSVSADHRECLGDILTSARHLTGMVDRLLDPARTDVVVVPETCCETVDLQSLLYDMRYVMQVLSAQKREVRIDLELDPAVRQVTAMPERLRELVTSYIDYAVKRVPDLGQVVIRTAAGGATSYRLEVEYGRAGQAPGHLTPEDSVARRHPETDTELALAKQLVERLGGQAGLHNPPGRGTVLYAILPSVTGAPIPKAAALHVIEGQEPARPHENPSSALEHLRHSMETLGVVPDGRRPVLVVGQILDGIQGMMAILEELGFQAVWLHDLKATLQVAAQEQPCAVVVDLQGDGLVDYEFVRRALRSVGLSTPVLGFPGAEIDSEHQKNRPAPAKEGARPRLEPFAAARKRSA